MNRRDALAAGVSLVTLAAAGKAFAVRPCPPTLSGTQPADCSQPPIQGQWQWNVPSVQDETDFYTNVLGWTIPSGEPNFNNSFSGSYDWFAPPSFSFGVIDSETENDDLWTWYQQKQRYGASFVVNGAYSIGDWFDEVLRVYKSDLIAKLDQYENSETYPHMYGQGLATVYNDTNDPSILPILDQLRTRIEGTANYTNLVGGGTMTIARNGARATSRHAIIAAHAYQATGDPNWRTVRDNLVLGFTTADDWQDHNDISILPPGTGCFFAPRGVSRINVAGSSYASSNEAYDDGWRYHSTFMVGLMAEAMWRLYVQTGHLTLRERLVKMARYVQHYAHDPDWNYPNVGAYFGHSNTGGRFWSRQVVQTRGDGTLENADTDTSYDAALINVMVIGYKLTGEQAMLDKARVFFSRCNRWLTNGAFRAGSENHLLKYVDTTPDLSRNKFRWNKGVLQYGYQIFENGGNPGTLV